MNYFAWVDDDRPDDQTNITYDYTASDGAHITGFDFIKEPFGEIGMMARVQDLIVREGMRFDYFIAIDKWFDPVVAGVFNVSNGEKVMFASGQHEPKPTDPDLIDLYWALVNMFDMDICPELKEDWPDIEEE